MDDERLKIVKYINDPVYGGIPITQIELELIDTPIFQRLRGLRQLARVNFVFPGAEHSRYVHSLGVLYIMGLMTNHLYEKGRLQPDDIVKMRVAALLHDIGHYPLSHLGETVYGYITDNEKNASGVVVISENSSNMPLYEIAASHSKSADHEHLGEFIINNNIDIKSILEKYHLNPNEIGQIITGEYGSRNMVYTQLLHSSLDADRLDYLLRDSFQTGVKYGLVDLQYLIRLLDVVEDKKAKIENKNILVCNKKGQHVVEHFLMSRYFHYSQAIYHKTNASFEGMIRCMFVKLVQSDNYIYRTLEEIHNAVNEDSLLNFNDASLDSALRDYYTKTDDEDYKVLYEMYRDRVRPKVVYEIKDLYEDNRENTEMHDLKRELKRNPEEFSKIIGTERWGYQNVSIKLEKVSCGYRDHEDVNEEDIREAIKLYDSQKDEITLLGADNLSIIGRLSDCTSEFVRIYAIQENGTEFDLNSIRNKIKEFLK